MIYKKLWYFRFNEPLSILNPEPQSFKIKKGDTFASPFFILIDQDYNLLFAFKRSLSSASMVRLLSRSLKFPNL